MNNNNFKIEEEPILSKEDFERSWNSRKYPMTIADIESNIDHLDMNQVLFCRADVITIDFLNKFKERTAKYIRFEEDKNGIFRIVFVVGDCLDILTKHTDLNGDDLDDDMKFYIAERMIKGEPLAPFSDNTYKYAYGA